MTLRKSELATAVLAAALLAIAPPAAAVWPVNPAVNLPVCTATGRQDGPPGIVSDGAGGVIVAWNDMRSGGYDVYAQHMMAAGYADPAWPANGRAIVSLSANQYSPMLIADGAGGAIVVWADDRAGSYAADLYAHHLRANGTLDPGWPAGGRLLSSGTGVQYSPVCISNFSGGAIVAWREARGSTGADLYVQQVTSAGAVSWGASGLLVCGVTGDQYQPVLAPDLSGGAVIAWCDYRKASSYDYDIYAARVLANGTLDPRWTTGGVALCTATGTQQFAGILADGLGGAFVAWQDGRSGTTSDLYAMHVRESGTLDPAWPANGRLLQAGGGGVAVVLPDASTGFVVVGADSVYFVKRFSAAGTPDPGWPTGGARLPSGTLADVVFLPDGAGGVLFCYDDYRANLAYPDIGAHHVRWDGVLDPAWPAAGRTLCYRPGELRGLPAAAGDGAGGAIVAWIDGRNQAATDLDVYAQRVRSVGRLGIPEPAIVSAQDIRSDEGGKLLLAWSASEGDAAPNPYVGRYHLWRKVDAAGAAARAAAGPVAEASQATPRPGEVRARGTGAQATWWEFIATVPASQMPNYAYTVTTTADSLPGWIPWNVFVVDAEDATAWGFYSSAPDSGYSADNLAPHLPAPAFGQYTQGMARLNWAKNTEPDFSVYRLYRGTRPDFSPGPANLVATVTDTSFLDLAGAPYYYSLNSVDVHGNASPNVLVMMQGILGAGEPPVPHALAFRGAQPNPVRGVATFAFDLPAPATVRITLFDVSGRRVRELAASLPAGSHRLAWDARDGAGAASPAGLYLARFEAPGFSKVERFVLTR